MRPDEMQARTSTEARNDLIYQIRLHELHATLFRRLKWLASLVSLLAGASAVTSWVQSQPGGVFVAGLVVTITGVLDILGRWEERGAAHRAWRRQFAEILAEAPVLSDEDLHAAYVRAEASVDDTLRSLERVAYNDAMRSLGLYTRRVWEWPSNWLMRLFV
ncbi:hypothetical protein [Dokdonella fugitiva]|jgi:hypothetical protein|uniref:SMODS and SLOG-associating 2TM effector domain-containing protein n=1 Tax=Dokdonella fugitiva TaxID=328517 RepID=A0A4V2S2H1_9GAMM|nr:hypothetical protein [Dokdonella fugitiva]TCO40430.1 hypothetical protein EV148_105225 [Dokdonella fugitiva]